MNTASNANRNVKEVVPFLHVSSMELSVRFYLDGIGFTMNHKWVVEGKLRWCWLSIGNASLMLQEFPKEGHDSWVPSGRVGEGVSLYFICEDAVTMYRELKFRSIQASEPQVGNAMWVTGLSDPDGYRLYFESATDTPEETKFSEPKR